jgi:hypothetical protein
LKNITNDIFENSKLKNYTKITQKPKFQKYKFMEREHQMKTIQKMDYS